MSTCIHAWCLLEHLFDTAGPGRHYLGMQTFWTSHVRAQLSSPEHHTRERGGEPAGGGGGGQLVGNCRNWWGMLAPKSIAMYGPVYTQTTTRHAKALHQVRREAFVTHGELGFLSNPNTPLGAPSPRGLCEAIQTPWRSVHFSWSGESNTRSMAAIRIAFILSSPPPGYIALVLGATDSFGDPSYVTLLLWSNHQD